MTPRGICHALAWMFFVSAVATGCGGSSSTGDDDTDTTVDENDEADDDPNDDDTADAEDEDDEDDENGGAGGKGGAGGMPIAGQGGSAGAAGAGGMGGMAGAGGSGGMNPAVDPNCPGRGKTIKINAGDDVATAVSMATGGEVLELAAGNYPASTISVTAKCATTVRSATEHGAVFASLVVRGKNLTVEGIKATGQVTVEMAETVVLKGAKVGPTKTCIRVKDTKDVVILRNSCQANDMLGNAVTVLGKNANVRLDGNRVEGGAYRMNSMIQEGDPMPGAAILVQGGGMLQPDGVAIVNNILSSFFAGVVLQGSRNVDVVNNTIQKTTLGLWEHWREDNDRKVVLKNERIRVWNNVLLSGESIWSIWYSAFGREEHNSTNFIPKPLLFTNNAVAKTEPRTGNFPGTGDKSVTGNLMLDGDLKPGATSPLRDAGLKNAETPTTDATGKARDDKPDIGAMEG